ncbi:hypothetical protein FFA01_22440 [Frigoribacterium faeni]|uniref:Uncharacterized protein n=2 Tax=Frigoribacterium faeni TaxID=145483 RepID=A0ABQ0USL4_9MICO|nr:hypothetical protein GCM10025699_61980 [Microbacterium flavescens]GEK83935.1 hypothetical protein FFA01_22440 [Frigoribacterium faeni]
MPPGIVVGMTDDTPAPRDVATARREIRGDEAKRLLGMLSAGSLPSRAEQWVLDGVDDASVRELAEALTRTDEQRAALLESAAASLGLGFASVREARAHHGEQIVAQMTASSAAGDALGYSNSFSDTIEESVRDSIARLFRPRG